VAFENRSTGPFAESVVVANAREGDDGLVMTDIVEGLDEGFSTVSMVSTAGRD